MKDGGPAFPTHGWTAAWLRGERSLTNIIPQHPFETWNGRIAEADAAMVQQAYWIVKAHTEGLIEQIREIEDGKG